MSIHEAIEAEIQDIWINFHTPAAQRAALELLERLKLAATKDSK